MPTSYRSVSVGNARALGDNFGFCLHHDFQAFRANSSPRTELTIPIAILSAIGEQLLRWTSTNSNGFRSLIGNTLTSRSPLRQTPSGGKAILSSRIAFNGFFDSARTARSTVPAHVRRRLRLRGQDDQGKAALLAR